MQLHCPRRAGLNTDTAGDAFFLMEFDLTREDEAPDVEFNQIIWRSIRSTEMPTPVHSAFVMAEEKKE